MTKLKKYQSLIAPSILWDKDTLTNNFGECIIQPLEPGFGFTIGNTIRRILLGGIEGSAVTSLIIDGVNNEFSTIHGVVEDTLRIILNIKQLVIKNETGEDGEISVDFDKKGPLLAKDFIVSDNLKIINEDLVIANLADDGRLKIKLFVQSGRGYRKAEWPSDQALQKDGRIYIDSTFAPVLTVSFDVKKTRVGEDIDYDKLIISMKTNGTINPIEAFDYSISVALNQFQALINKKEVLFSARKQDVKVSGNNVLVEDNVVTLSSKKINSISSILDQNIDPEIFLKSIDVLGLPARAHNCLISSGIQKVIELVNMSEHEVLSIKNFGSKSYDDLIQVMKDFRLTFNMNIDEKQILKYMGRNNETSEE
jgi:DNA-directed RNA polymerase subunit alpha